MVKRDDDAWDDDAAGTATSGKIKQLQRVLKIATLLTGEPYAWKRARLALELEVTERSIDRDLALLRALEYDIDHDPARGYAFVRTPTLPQVALTLPEVLALTLAAELARDTGGIDMASLGAALARLLGVMPAQARPLLQRELLRREEGKRTEEGARKALSAIQQAWLQGRQARIVYATGMRGGELSERVIEPYKVFPYEGSWYVTAYDHRRADIIDFKIGRMRQVTVLREAYEIPATFDMAAYRGPAWGILRDEASAPVEIELLFDREAGRWVQEEGRAEQISFEAQEDGSVLARLTAGVTPEFVRWILWYGPHCRVLGPDSLREQVRVMAEEAARINV